jgi:hypothetical protein
VANHPDASRRERNQANGIELGSVPSFEGAHGRFELAVSIDSYTFILRRVPFGSGVIHLLGAEACRVFRNSGALCHCTVMAPGKPECNGYENSSDCY